MPVKLPKAAVTKKKPSRRHAVPGDDPFQSGWSRLSVDGQPVLCDPHQRIPSPVPYPAEGKGELYVRGLLWQTRTTLSALVDKLELIYNHPAYKSVFTLAHVRNMPYDGPTWEAELKVAKALLLNT